MKPLQVKVTWETKREKIKDAVQQVLEEQDICRNIDTDIAYEFACQVADKLEGNI